MKKANKYIKPMSLPEHLEMFGTEEQCREHLFNARFGNGFVCPKCGCEYGYKITTCNVMKCSNCEYQLSAMCGTIFQASKTPLTKWYLAIYLITIDKRGIAPVHVKADMTLKDLQSKFPRDRYWNCMPNHGTNNENGTTSIPCNNHNNSNARYC